MDISTVSYGSNGQYGMSSETAIEKAEKVLKAANKTDAVKEATGGKSDSVTLSHEYVIAQKRETLGLPPTGKLTRSDFQNLIDSDAKTVESALKKAMEKLGIKADTKVSLSLDSKGNISVQGSFEEKKNLQDLLNDDKDLVKSFKRQSTNSEILNFTKSVQSGTSSMNLLSVMDSGSDFSGLFKAISARYDQASQGSNDPLTLIAGYGKGSNPFTFKYEPKP